MADYTVSLTETQEAILKWLGATPQALVDQKLQDYTGAYNEAKEDFRLYQKAVETDPAIVAEKIATAQALEAAEAKIAESQVTEEPIG
jgi:hypothetical protein